MHVKGHGRLCVASPVGRVPSAGSRCHGDAAPLLRNPNFAKARLCFRFAARALRFEGRYRMNRPIPLIALLVTVSLSTFSPYCVADDVSEIKAEVTKRHDE